MPSGPLTDEDNIHFQDMAVLGFFKNDNKVVFFFLRIAILQGGHISWHMNGGQSSTLQNVVIPSTFA